MKSTVSEKPCEAEIEYPCLRGDVYKIILFGLNKKGTVISVESSSVYKVGEHIEGGKAANYKPFHGSVCLEN